MYYVLKYVIYEDFINYTRIRFFQSLILNQILTSSDRGEIFHLIYILPLSQISWISENALEMVSQ